MKTRTVVLAALVLATSAATLFFSNAKTLVASHWTNTQNGQLVMVWGVIQSNEQAPSSMADLTDWKAANRVFEQLGAYVPGNIELTAQAKTESLRRASVSANFFSILGVKPQLGRDFIPAEDQPGAGAQVAIVSYELWQNRLNSNPAIVGKTIVLDHEDYTVIGVMPKGFQFPTSTDLWTPLGLDPRQLDRSTRFLNVVARLKPGVSLDQARTEMNGIARQLQQRYPETNNGWGINLAPLSVP
jgi:putative ABC transport system permease protein